jgi:hypothetical protein
MKTRENKQIWSTFESYRGVARNFTQKQNWFFQGENVTKLRTEQNPDNKNRNFGSEEHKNLDFTPERNNLDQPQQNKILKEG